MELLYPESPRVENFAFLRPSKDFRQAARRVVLSILLFLLFYLVLIMLSIWLLLATIDWARALIEWRPSLLPIVLGAGLVALGAMCVIFTIKFIFSKTIDDDPLRHQITETEHPKLFEFIRRLAGETKTSLPKKIFISPGVNAAVFYNSSFWSLFFPVPKNLEIGLGLVNTLNISEFKAVLAHEFGHFSQRSMRLGSYIYTVNRVIFNLVFERDNWDSWLEEWIERGGITGIFGAITFLIVQIVRGLLSIAYGLVNAAYSRLSVEMEHHADLVAVSVSGNTSFLSAMRKSELSTAGYEAMQSILVRLSGEEKCLPNMYEGHTALNIYLARQQGLEVRNDQVRISDEDLHLLVSRSRVNYKDQWASHPELIDRERFVSRVSLEGELILDSAWILFNDPKGVQREETHKTYELFFQEAKQPISLEDFEHYVDEASAKGKISDQYNGFYDLGRIEEFDLIEAAEASSSVRSLAEIYSPVNVELIKRWEANETDLQTLKSIKEGGIAVKYFEFDGTKYKRRASANLVEAMQNEVDDQKAEVSRLIREAYRVNYKMAQQAGLEKKLQDLYEDLFASQRRMDNSIDLYMQLNAVTEDFYSDPEWLREEPDKMVKKLYPIEKEFLEFLQAQPKDVILGQIDDEEGKAKLNEYWEAGKLISETPPLTKGSVDRIYELINGFLVPAVQLQGKSLKVITDFQLQFLPGDPGSPSI